MKKKIAILISLSVAAQLLLPFGVMAAQDAPEEETEAVYMEAEADRAEIAETPGGGKGEKNGSIPGSDTTVSGNGKTEIQIKKEAARAALMGSTLTHEAVLKLGSMGGKPIYTIDLQASSTSQNLAKDGSLELCVTMCKGDKLLLPGFSKSGSNPEKEKKSSVRVNSKGVLTAKKESGIDGSKFSYTADGRRINLSVIVVVPEIYEPMISGNTIHIGEAHDLIAEFEGEGRFDIKMTHIPLTAKCDVAKTKQKKKMKLDTVDNGSDYFSIDSEGYLHITGFTSGKCSARIPFMAYGKKYVLKIKGI